MQKMRLFFLVEPITALKWICVVAVAIVLVVAYKILLSSLWWCWLLSFVCGGASWVFSGSGGVCLFGSFAGFHRSLCRSDNGHCLFGSAHHICRVGECRCIGLVRPLVCSGRGPSSQEFHVQSFIFTLLLLSSRDCSFNLIKEISSTSLASLSSLTTL